MSENVITYSYNDVGSSVVDEFCNYVAGVTDYSLLEAAYDRVRDAFKDRAMFLLQVSKKNAAMSLEGVRVCEEFLKKIAYEGEPV